MSQKLLEGGLNLFKNASQVNEDFIKNCKRIVMQDIFLRLIFNTLENYIKITFFTRKNENCKARKTCVQF